MSGRFQIRFGLSANFETHGYKIKPARTLKNGLNFKLFALNSILRASGRNFCLIIARLKPEGFDQRAIIRQKFRTGATLVDLFTGIGEELKQ